MLIYSIKKYILPSLKSSSNFFFIDALYLVAFDASKKNDMSEVKKHMLLIVNRNPTATPKMIKSEVFLMTCY